LSQPRLDRDMFAPAQTPTEEQRHGEH